MFNFKRLIPSLDLSRETMRGLLTLLNVLIFSIIIIVDIVAFFQGRSLELLVVLSLLTGSLVAYSQAWYFGSLNLQNQKSSNRSTNIKPSVRIIERPMTKEDLEISATKKMEE